MINLINKDKQVFLGLFIFYLLLIIASFIIGSSFSTSVNLYSNASVSAMDDPLYAKEFDPFEGIFVPTIGSLYLVFTLILPFVVVPLVSDEFEKNSIIMLFNMYNGTQIILSKFLIAFLYILIIVSFTLPAVCLFLIIGGHFTLSEYLLIILGYILYGCIIIGLSFFITTVFRSKTVSTMITVGVLILPWIVGFLKDYSQSRILDILDYLSFARLLKPFEQGIFSFYSLIVMIVWIIIFVVLSIFMIEFYNKNRFNKILAIFFVLFVFLILFRFDKKVDISESKRNSFPPSVSSVLRDIKNLEIEIHLNKYDSRFIDYNNEFLKRLLVVNSHVTVKYKDDENYGIFVYKRYYNGNIKSDTTYSNSREEAFDIISSLYGVKIEDTGDYTGYPMIVSSDKIRYSNVVYYFLLPALLVGVYVKRRLL